MKEVKQTIEIWKDIPGYEGIYMVSTFGNIKSLDRYVIKSNGVRQLKHGKLLESQFNQDGYLQCKLCKDGKHKTVRVHRIVASVFIPNPDNLPEVNHKDCNRSNNHIENLEWATHKENVVYSTNLGHYKKPIGKDNWNYGGTKLKKYYENHPDEKLKLARPGAQNGRACPLVMIMNNQTIEFEYIGECARYLIENGIITNLKYDSLHTRIVERLRTGKEYKDLKFIKK